MTLERTVRNLSPAALDIYKRQVSEGIRRGDPAYTRLVSMPEFADVFQGANYQPITQKKTGVGGDILNTFMAPFNWIGEHITEPFGTIVTSPFTSSKGMTRQKGENWFDFEKRQYEEQVPGWLKFGIETLPWLAIPGVGSVGGGVGQAGRGIAGALGRMGGAGRWAGKVLEFSPWGLTEKATGKVLSTVGKGVSKGIKGVVGKTTTPLPTTARAIVPKVTAELMPDLQDINKAIDIASRPDALRKLGSTRPFQGISRILAGKSANMKTVENRMMVGRQILLAEGETKTVAAISRLKQLGSQDKVFGAIGKDGRFIGGEARGILQNELFTYPQKYIGKLNPVQKQWLQISDDIERAKNSFLKRNGIKFKELKFEDGGVYAGQRVAGKFNKVGELQDVAYIGAGARRPGAKAAFLKTRIFTDPEEAANLGYRYLARDEALSLNLQAAYNTVANKKSTDWLLERIPYRTAGATELTQAKRLNSVISRMRTKSIPYVAKRETGDFIVAWKKYIGRKPNANELRLLAKEHPEFINRIKNVASKEQLDEIFNETTALLQKTQLEWNALTKTEQIAQRAYARTPKFGEAIVQAPAFQGKILTGETAQKTAELLNKEFSPQYSEALAAVNRVNAVGRYFALAGDASPFGIQLIFLPWTNPRAYVESVKGFLKAFTDKEFLANYIARNADIINDSPNLLISAFEPTEAMRASGILGKLPVIKNVLEPFTRAYDSAMTVAGVEMKKALRHLATTPERVADVDAFINELRGVISTSKLGISMTQRQTESALILASKYNRAIASLLVDAIRGGLRGTLARDALIKSTVGISAMAVGVSYALGEDEKDIIEHLDPRSSRFLTWQIAGQNVGPGSKVRSILKLIGDSTKDPEDLVRLSMENPALRFVRGNLAPAVSTGLDLLTGKNYIGDPSRDGMMTLSKTVIGENLVPIWLQSMIWEGGELKERGVRGVTEFFGGRTYPMTPYQELEEARNTIAQQTHGMDWDDIKQNLGELSQIKLEQSNPELKRLKEVAQKESSKMATGETAVWDEWNQLGQSIENRYRVALTQAGQEYSAIGDGVTFREKVEDASLVRREMYAQREQNPDFESIIQSFNEPLTEEGINTMNPLDVARREYYKSVYADDMYDQYGNYMFDLADQREAQFVSQYGQQALDYIQGFAGAKWEEPPAVKTLKLAKQTLQSYWEITNQVWSQYPPQLKQIADQIEILERNSPAQAKRMLTMYPTIVIARRQIALLKKRLKAINPPIANALRMFYSY